MWCSTDAGCFFKGPRWLIYPILSYPILYDNIPTSKKNLKSVIIYENRNKTPKTEPLRRLGKNFRKLRNYGVIPTSKTFLKKVSLFMKIANNCRLPKKKTFVDQIWYLGPAHTSINLYLEVTRIIIEVDGGSEQMKDSETLRQCESLNASNLSTRLMLRTKDPAVVRLSSALKFYEA